MRVARLAIPVLACGLLAGGPACADVPQADPPVAPETLNQLITAWHNATETRWSIDGGTYKERCIDTAFSVPVSTRAIWLDPGERAFRLRTREHEDLATDTIERDRRRADRTVKEIRVAMRWHGVRHVPRWTGRALNRNAALSHYDRMTHLQWKRPGPDSAHWLTLNTTSGPDGTTTYTGTFQHESDLGDHRPYYTAILQAVADPQQRLTAWRETGENIGSFDKPPTAHSCTLAWRWVRPTIALPAAGCSLRKVVRTEAALRTEVSSIAKAVSSSDDSPRKITVPWLQRTFRSKYSSPIAHGLRFTRKVDGLTLAWKVVLNHRTASYHVVRTAR